MEFIRISRREDFGVDWYVQILNTTKHCPRPFKNRSLLQMSVSWNDYPSWPYIQISSGNGTFLSVLFWVYKFGFDVDFISRTWSYDYLETIGGEETKLV